MNQGEGERFYYENKTFLGTIPIQELDSASEPNFVCSSFACVDFQTSVHKLRVERWTISPSEASL